MKNNFTLLALLILFLTNVLAKEVVQDFSQEKLEEFDAYIEQQITKNNIAGAEVLILKDKISVWHTALGYKNLKTKTALDKNSIYYIQSMTKPIISTAIMQLVEQEKISLNDPIEKYIPEVATLRVTTDPEKGINGPTTERKAGITIKQLLTHTAGFSHGLGETLLDKELFAGMYNETLNYKGHKNLESRIAFLLSTPLIGQPGEQWFYSASPDLLALILQRVSKQSIPDYLEERVFNPIGMTDTGYNLTAAQAKRVMQLHTISDAGVFGVSELQVPTSGNTVYGGTHGLFSTAVDYAKFCQMFLDKGMANGTEILDPETVALMQENHVGTFIGDARGFGLGFGVLYNTENDPSPAQSGQFYWGGYFRTHFFIDPTENIIALFMTQKLPYGEDYNIALNRAVYGSLKK
jgi:CubicO group peptidase (beta-lactamase class C family)